MAKKWPQKRLLKDIVIPAGTVFEVENDSADDTYVYVLGLTRDTYGELKYYADVDPELSEWFEDV